MPGLIAGGGEIAPAPPTGGGTRGVLGVLGRLDTPCNKTISELGVMKHILMTLLAEVLTAIAMFKIPKHHLK